MRERSTSIRETYAIYERVRGYFDTPQAIKQSTRLWRRGLREKFYVDFDILVTDPGRCGDIGRLYAHMIETMYTRADILGFIEKEKSGEGTTGAIKLAGLISTLVGIPHVAIRLGKELPFERVKIPRRDNEPLNNRLGGATVLIITDHLTTGGEAINAANAIENCGGTAIGVLSLTSIPKKIDWDEFARRRLEFKSIYAIPDDLLKGTKERISAAA